MRWFKKFPLWAILKYVALAIITFVIFTMVAEAYDIKQAVTWVSEKIINLVWNIPRNGSHHYSVEVTKTELLREPVTSYVFHTYTNENNLQIELNNNCSYTFRVQSADEYGTLSTYSEQSPLYIYEKSEATQKTSVSDEKPQDFSISQNYPNPFNKQTTIKYYIPSSKNEGGSVPIQFVIYNTLGQKVRTLVNGSFPPGEYIQIWDGRNDAGQEVSSGHYMYQLTAGKFRASKKMLLMK
jgi:hypothetical protein